MQDRDSLKADERLALDLMAAIRADAETVCAPQAVEMVSVTIDVSAAADADSPVELEAQVDRRTRTILFTGGLAKQNGVPVMKATAVYRILSD